MLKNSKINGTEEIDLIYCTVTDCKLSGQKNKTKQRKKKQTKKQ